MKRAPLLEAEGLAIRIGERWLCCEFSLSLRPGECLALLGPNGAGKTTLLHTLAGLRAPSVGSVRVGGKPYADWPGSSVACFRGLLAQQQPDHFAASVLETALVGRHPHLGRWDWEGAEDLRITREALAAVGLEGFEARDVLTLSAASASGWRLPRCWSSSHGCICSTSPQPSRPALPDRGTRPVPQRGGRRPRVVMVMHDINLAARYADHVILLDGRGGVAAGTADEILQAERLSHAFGHPLRAVTDGERTLFIPD